MGGVFSVGTKERSINSFAKQNGNSNPFSYANDGGLDEAQQRHESGDFVASRGNTKVSILAFEVGNTIANGAYLFQSLSEQNIQNFKKDVLHSEGVQKLVSTNIKELLSIAAADKRDELDIFSREVIRFGDLCIDRRWHNLGRYFSKLDIGKKQDSVEAEMTMNTLTSLAQHTSELFHELNALDRFDIEYRRKLDEVEALNLPKRGEDLMILQSELKQQRKLARSLKKKSLWSKILEEIVEKLVDIVTYMHQAIFEAFGETESSVRKETPENSLKLGVGGLALHYANVIQQIDNIAARPASLPPNIRDTLYNGLPPTVKKALRSRLLSIDAKGERSISHFKDEIEKTLQWLVPVATNTTRAHQDFRWVGEWAKASNEFGRSAAINITFTRLQTFYHADKQKTDAYILELVASLHHLISLVKQRDHGFEPHPLRSPTYKGLGFHSKMQHRFLSYNGENKKANKIELSQEDRNLLNKVSGRRLVPGISKSQELPLGENEQIKVWALSSTAGNSPDRSSRVEMILKRSKAHILDVMDGLDLAA